ncbi:MAG: GntR family transcriptional regulator [Chloroflexi bacterium]|nr:MAG: GntR family transcriptional regulator [Chloroflexota bacterium]
MMTLPLGPLHVASLKEACINRLEELILSGELKKGDHLPSERDLAARLGVSRPVLHEAIVDLAAKGLVTIIPRRGVVINDFRKSGSFAILSSLLSYHNGELAPQLVDSLLSMRILIETETARLASTNASQEQINGLREIIKSEFATNRRDLALLTELDFEFHLLISIASENLVYPLILNSFKSVYTHFTSAFFVKTAGSSLIDEVFGFHKKLVDAFEERQCEKSAEIMRALLIHGEKHLRT